MKDGEKRRQRKASTRVYSRWRSDLLGALIANWLRHIDIVNESLIDILEWVEGIDEMNYRCR